MKTIERAHLPSKMWERVKLSGNYTKALEQVSCGRSSAMALEMDANPLSPVDRLTAHVLARLSHPQVQAEDHQDHSVLNQDEEAQAQGGVGSDVLLVLRECVSSLHFIYRPQLVPIKKKLERRESARESKALTAARLEKSLEKELIARLKSRAYGDQPLNVNEDVWRAVLNREKEVEAEKELEELGMMSDETTEDEDSENEMEDDEDEREFVSDMEDESDLEDMKGYEMDGAEVSSQSQVLGSRLFAELSASPQYDSADDLSEESGFDEASDSGDEAEDDSEDEAPSKKRKAPAPPPSKGKGKGPVQPKKPRKSEFRQLKVPSRLVANLSRFPEGPRVEVEYEQETQPLSAAQMDSW
jgi:protein MAK16